MEDEPEIKFYTIPPSFNKDVSPEAEELIIRMSKARGMLHLDLPFFGFLLSQLEIYPVNSSVNSFAMDTRRLYVNTSFFKRLTAAQMRVHMLHAIIHIILKHGERSKGRNNKIWGIASDINVMDMVFNTLREHELLSQRIETYYEFQHRNIPNHLKKVSVDDIDKILFEYAKSYLDEKESKLPADRINFSAEVIEEVLNYADTDLPCNYIELYEETAGSLDLIYQTAEENRFLGMLKFAYLHAKQQGKLPSELMEFVDGLISPKIPWYNYLEQFVQRAIISDFRWIPPNKRLINQKIYLPSTKKENLTGVIALDTSGSISNDELMAFLSEVMAIFNSFYHFKLTIIQCDAQIQQVVNLDEGENIDGGELPWESKTVYGRGGTSFRPVFEYIEKHELKPSLLVYFTDGYGTFPDYEPEYATYWVMTSDVLPPFGDRIEYNIGSGTY